MLSIRTILLAMLATIACGQSTSGTTCPDAVTLANFNPVDVDVPGRNSGTQELNTPKNNIDGYWMYYENNKIPQNLVFNGPGVYNGPGLLAVYQGVQQPNAANCGGNLPDNKVVLKPGDQLELQLGIPYVFHAIGPAGRVSLGFNPAHVLPSTNCGSAQAIPDSGWVSDNILFGGWGVVDANSCVAPPAEQEHQPKSYMRYYQVVGTGGDVEVELASAAIFDGAGAGSGRFIVSVYDAMDASSECQALACVAGYEVQESYSTNSIFTFSTVAGRTYYLAVAIHEADPLNGMVFMNHGGLFDMSVNMLSLQPTTSSSPSSTPSAKPSISPSSKPSISPSVVPSALPSVYPSLPPSSAPSAKPTFPTVVGGSTCATNVLIPTSDSAFQGGTSANLVSDGATTRFPEGTNGMWLSRLSDASTPKSMVFTPHGALRMAVFEGNSDADCDGALPVTPSRTLLSQGSISLKPATNYIFVVYGETVNDIGEFDLTFIPTPPSPSPSVAASISPSASPSLNPSGSPTVTASDAPTADPQGLQKTSGSTVVEAFEYVAHHKLESLCWDKTSTHDAKTVYKGHRCPHDPTKILWHSMRTVDQNNRVVTCSNGHLAYWSRYGTGHDDWNEEYLGSCGVSPARVSLPTTDTMVLDRFTYTVEHSIPALCFGKMDTGATVRTVYHGSTCPNGDPAKIRWDRMETVDHNGHLVPYPGCSWNRLYNNDSWNDHWLGSCGVHPIQVPELPTDAI